MAATFGPALSLPRTHAGFPKAHVSFPWTLSSPRCETGTSRASTLPLPGQLHDQGRESQPPRPLERSLADAGAFIDNPAIHTGAALVRRLLLWFGVMSCRAADVN
jgi:hypothetical protein